MKVWLLRFAILVLFAFSALWWSVWQNYSFPKGPEWVKALHAYQANPTPENREELHKQTILNSQRNRRNDEIVKVVLCFADIGVAFYVAWNWGTKKNRKT